MSKTYINKDKVKFKEGIDGSQRNRYLRHAVRHDREVGYFRPLRNHIRNKILKKECGI